MSSEAMADIGPTTPSRLQIARRIRSARELLKMAEERLNADELGMAQHWLQRASNEAAPITED